MESVASGAGSRHRASALSAPVVAALGNLELAARLVVEGANPGRHRSLLKGLSSEFQEHRPYRAGDDLKHLDWKLLARTDRLHTRQYRDTTSLAMVVVLDTSASMAFPEPSPGSPPAPTPAPGTAPGAAPPPLSRFHYARILAAALAWLAATGGDGAGLLAGGGDTLSWTPPRTGRRHLRRLVATLDGLAPGGRWDAASAVDRAALLLPRRGLVVLLSDLYDDEDRTLAALRRAAVRGHDTAILQLTSPQETDFPWSGTLRFHDAETGHERLVNASEAAALHRAALAAFHRHCTREAARLGIDHRLISLDEPPAMALRRFLLPRSR